MKILVPVKRVIDPYEKVRPLPDGSGIDSGSLKFEINPFDEIAVEEAVRQRDANGSIEIVVVTIGTSACEDQLRKALAMGADRGIFIETEDILDSAVVAAELEAIVRSESPQVVLMGKQATDDDSNQSAQILAERLGWPQATFAASLVLMEDRARVVRETDQGEETVELSLPAVVTTDLRLNEPRYIALPAIIKARSKPVERRPRATDLQARVRLVHVEAPPARPPGKKVNSVEELVDELRSRGVVR